MGPRTQIVLFILLLIFVSFLVGMILRIIGCIFRQNNERPRAELLVAMAAQFGIAAYWVWHLLNDLYEAMLENAAMWLVAIIIVPILVMILIGTYLLSLLALRVGYAVGLRVYYEVFTGLVAKREQDGWRRAEARIDEHLKSQASDLRK